MRNAITLGRGDLRTIPLPPLTDVDILNRMGRLLATFMLALMAALACTDPLLCPDGCADEPSAQARTPAPAHADCLACRNAISIALPTFDLTPGGSTEPGDHELPQQITNQTPFSIDHPPRAM